MEMSFLLVEQICQLFLMMFLGFLLVRGKILESNQSVILSKVLLYVVSPCTIINSFSVEFSQDKLIGLGIAFLGAIIAQTCYIPLTYLLSRFFGFTQIEKASIIYSNAGNLIIPLVGAVLGQEWVLYTSAYIVVQTILMWTHAKTLVSGERNYDFKNIFGNVNIIAIGIGLIIFFLQVPLPHVFIESIDKVGSMMGPLGMIVIGMLIGQMSFRDIFYDKRTYLVCFMRLIVLPVFMVFVLKILGLENLTSESSQILLVTTLAMSAPVATTITQFAQLYNKHPGYAGVLNVMSVLLSVITMPVLTLIYQVL